MPVSEEKASIVPKEYPVDLYRIRHSCAHILAQAVQQTFENQVVLFAGGPPIHDGFYYDFLLPRPLNEQDLHELQVKIIEILKKKQVFERIEVKINEALKIFENQPFKLEIIEGLQKSPRDDGDSSIESVPPAALTIYQSGSFKDLCQGPHVESTAEIDPAAIRLLKVSGAYWKGDEKRPMLQRIYGTAWRSPKELENYINRLAEADMRDHRKLGKELEFFFFHDTAPGMPYWLPRGFTVLNELIHWWRKIHEREEYQEISSPLINSKRLWEISGHWDHYRDDMFVMEVKGGQTFGVKPMNCPNAMLTFSHKLRSYRDLPFRLSDCDILHRHERSGALHGLLRVQKFQQDDAHIFVVDEEDSIAAEYRRILCLVEEFYSVFNLKYRFRLGTRPKDSLGDDQLWGRAEAALHKILDAAVGPDGYSIAEGDGAFYGPKIDILIQDAIGRDWQMGTIQLDFQLPRRFNCEYVDRNGQRATPAVIHRVIYGSLERFIGILIEHTAGQLPLWLSPVQVAILPIQKRHEDYAMAVKSVLIKAGVRVSLEAGDDSMGKRLKRLRPLRIPLIVVVGDQEVDQKSVTFRRHGKEERYLMPLSDFAADIARAISLKEEL
jgi:threonyl-tRNA synthetase